MYALHSLYSPPGRLQRSGLIVKYGLTSIHTIHTFLPCASSHPSLIRASPHPPIYLGCACPFPQSRDNSLTHTLILVFQMGIINAKNGTAIREAHCTCSEADKQMFELICLGIDLQLYCTSGV